MKRSSWLAIRYCCLALLPVGLSAFYLVHMWDGNFSHLPTFRHGLLFTRDRLFRDVVVGYYPAYEPITKVFSSGGIHYGMECFATADIDVTPEGDDVESQVGSRSCGNQQPLYGEIAFLQSNPGGRPFYRPVLHPVDFLPLGVCYDANKDVWIAGRSSQGTMEGTMEFRKYLISGEQLGVFSSDFRSPDPAGSRSAETIDARRIEMSASSDRIGAWFKSDDGKRVWTERSLDGREIFRTTVTDSGLARVAFTGDSRVYSQRPGQNGRGGELFELDHTSGDWRARGSLEAYQILVGADGDQLAFADSRVGGSVRVTLTPEPGR